MNPLGNHDDINASIYKEVKHSNWHFIIISVLSGIWMINKDVQRFYKTHKMIILSVLFKSKSHYYVLGYIYKVSCLIWFNGF